MEKIDYKKEFKNFYSAAKEPQLVTVPKMSFFIIDGQGDPNTAKAYQEAIEALYGLSYTIKFMIKKGSRGCDYGVLPLESLWWSEEMADFVFSRKDKWQWSAMIMQPEIVTREIVEIARQELAKKKNPPGLPRLHFLEIEEGLSAQIMHTGPFSEEGPTIAKLHNYIKSNGYYLQGKHHEIYLTDIRRAKPEAWKTIIRQPVGK